MRDTCDCERPGRQPGSYPMGRKVLAEVDDVADSEAMSDAAVVKDDQSTVRLNV